MIRCGVVGASGYAGAELVALLAAHPGVRLAAVQADASAGRRFEELHPARAHRFTGALSAFDPAALAGLDVVFLALPHGVSAGAAGALDGRAGLVIDLSGDLRLGDAPAYRRAYRLEHQAPHLLGRAVYGLPELNRRELPGATLIACAGCYATAAQLAAAPLLALGPGAVGPEVVVAAMSGTTGAGRRAEVELSFSEVAGNLRAYRVGRHPHRAEIAAGLERHAGRPIAVTFVPHLVPIARGIFATVCLRNVGGLDAADALGACHAAYDRQPFVRVVDPAVRLPQVSDVVHTNFCDLAPVVDEEAGTIVVLAVLDNLLKGAAGQAVQAMNIACGLPETLGLPAAAGAGIEMEEVSLA